MSIRPARSVLWAVTAVVLLWAANLFLGSVRIPFAEVWAVLTGGEASQPSWGYIVLESRLPQAVVALLSGAALAVSGLMLQTVFSNPLAGPSVLGIDSGASLGVALVMLSLGGTVGGGLALTGYLAVVAGAFAGAASILGIIIFFSTLVRSNVMLLIIGIMVGYLTSSLISLLNFFATDEGIRSYCGEWATFRVSRSGSCPFSARCSVSDCCSQRCSSSRSMPCCWASVMPRIWACG